jgi:hypothetical protein
LEQPRVGAPPLPNVDEEPQGKDSVFFPTSMPIQRPLEASLLLSCYLIKELLLKATNDCLNS